MKLTNGTRDFALTLSSMKGNRLPKRGGSVELIVNGNPTKGIVTTNAAWCGSPSETLDYIWVEIEGKAYYATLDYAEPASSWNGAEVTISEGTGPKPPKRLTGTADKGLTEFEREQKFRATWKSRYAA